MKYEDVIMALTVFGLVVGSVLVAIGLWQIKKHKHKSVS